MQLRSDITLMTQSDVAVPAKRGQFFAIIWAELELHHITGHTFAETVFPISVEFAMDVIHTTVTQVHQTVITVMARHISKVAKLTKHVLCR